MRDPKKRCEHCGHWFEPDPRTAAHQRYCSRPECQRARKQESQRRWLANNADYFQGHVHYVQHKNWLAKPGNEGYQRRYRARNPSYRAADNRRRVERRREQKAREKVRRVSDMKDVIHRREIDRIQGLKGSDMKDAIEQRLDGLLQHLATCPWSWRSDMKDEIALPKPPA